MEVVPIAVTGIGCRFPGDVNDVDAFWKMLMDGVDAVADIPSERWLKDRFHHPEKGRDYRTPQAQGGFLSKIDGFDPAFFGISPREASSLDPQQRMLLEVAWEALEDAGYPLEKVAGTRMGVFTGASSHDYYDIQDLDSLTTHSVTGWAMCMTSNRISYAFDLHGPSMTIDTACSSALVALHAAVTSIQRGESDGALVCAVNALLHPIHHVAFSRLSMLSPTSRCHAFDSSGDGYVRSEGAGVVVLKPLEKALADGDHIYATILRTMVNSDGRNEGLTFPSVEGQIRLLRDSYAGLPVEKVRYLEAHGTGTQAGDPVETTAIGTVLGHESRKLKVGSVKTNIGHLEAGAGMVDSFTGSAADLLRMLISEWWQRMGGTPLAGVPKLMISEAGNFPELAIYYHAAVIAPGRELMRRVLRRGIAAGEFRGVDVETAIDVIFAPVLMMLIWRYSLGACCGIAHDPHDYLQTHFDLALNGLIAPRSPA